MNLCAILKDCFFLDIRDFGTGSTLLLAVRLKLTYLYFKRGDPYSFWIRDGGVCGSIRMNLYNSCDKIWHGAVFEKVHVVAGRLFALVSWGLIEPVLRFAAPLLRRGCQIIEMSMVQYIATGLDWTHKMKRTTPHTPPVCFSYDANPVVSQVLAHPYTIPHKIFKLRKWDTKRLFWHEEKGPSEFFFWLFRFSRSHLAFYEVFSASSLANAGKMKGTNP